MTRLPAGNPAAGPRPSRLAEWQAMGFAPQACPIRTILDQVAAKWTVLILLELHDGPKRFNALLRALPDISRRMLTQGLRDLEQNGLLRRTVFDTRPPAVEYALTALGESLMGPLLGLVDWATTHREAVFAAQRQYQDSQSD
ncbi:winged helix-turn-helix transcriptional regulator [Novosphingobium piscinae]